MFFNGAADKLKKEQEKRKADLQRRQATERRAAAVVDAQKAARAEEERRERAEEQQRKAEERAALELVLANNEGVRWESRLIGTRSDAAMQRGIRARADDKIVLPPSAWHALQNAGAAGMGGHMFFEVSTVGGEEKRRTHAGVLGFDGVEGNVGLPAQVLRQLGVSTSSSIIDVNRGSGEGGEPTSEQQRRQQAAPSASASIVGGVVGGAVDVKVSYRRLPKGTYCKLQPRSQDFQGELAAEADVDLGGLLEQAVVGRCTLTVGDEVRVSWCGKEYPLRVVEVQPDDAGGAVSLIETDVEVDIAPSQDYEEAMRRLAEAESRRLAAAAEASRERDDRRRKDEEEAAIAAAEEARKAVEAAAAAERAERYRAAVASALPPEPDADVAGAVPCRFTLPDGKTYIRRFAPTDPLQAVFDYVRSVGGAGEDEKFRLVTRWPRTVIEAPDATETTAGVYREGGGGGGGMMMTVGARGLQPSDTFFVERIASWSE